VGWVPVVAALAAGTSGGPAAPFPWLVVALLVVVLPVLAGAAATAGSAVALRWRPVRPSSLAAD
jgi:hypothetical protein